MIPLVDLKAQYLSIKDEIDAAIQAVLDSGAFIGGRQVGEFERSFARFCQANEAVGVASGTAALNLALMACDIGPGDEVITTPYTFIATVETIANAGARPVLVDIDEKTFNIDPIALEEAVTERTKAVIPVHIYGQPAEMDPILKLAREHDIRVIEDAAQSHGAEYRGRRTGSMGDLACFSFYPAKNLGAYGDGGMVTTQDPELASRIRRLKDHGRTDKYTHSELGHGERLDTIQAAILDVKLRHLENWTDQRIAGAARYDELLSDLPVIRPHRNEHVRHAYHLYVIRVPERDRVLANLQESGIGAGVHYPLSLHQQPALSYLGYEEGDFPVSEATCEEVISLPLFPEMTDEQAHEVVDALKSAIAN
jgi:dTDP-4-amino-4,6-dideoxygalactose transaminase